MNRLLILSLLLLLAFPAWSNSGPVPITVEFPDTASCTEDPMPIPWILLTSTQFETTYDEKLGIETSAPVFSSVLQQLNGKLVQIQGYVIPYDENQSVVALSANPYAACFFCGKASPASVLTLRFAKPGKRYKVDAYHTFEGRLRLNYSKTDDFYFILEEAREV